MSDLATPEFGTEYPPLPLALLEQDYTRVYRAIVRTAGIKAAMAFGLIERHIEQGASTLTLTELASDWSVSENTARRIIRRLEDTDWLCVERGRRGMTFWIVREGEL
jgi:transcription initiation factor IIE alpha subunit